MSNDLVWAVIKKHNSFMRRNNGITLSAEPFNVRNKHTKKYSGLANTRAVDVRATKTKSMGLQVAVTTKDDKKANKPKTAASRSVITRHRVAGKMVGRIEVAKLTKGKYYRGDIAKYAIARYHAIRAANAKAQAKN